MKKIDYKKELKSFYKASAKQVEIVDVPAMHFLMIEGQGDPNVSQSFQEAVEALFSLAYALKFMIKKGEAAIDYGVMPLEGLWWADDMEDFCVARKDRWKWSLRIMQPEIVDADLVQNARLQVEKKKHPAALPLVRYASFTEGKAAQILHVGPFSDEGPTVEKLHAFIAQKGGERTGMHHEIYLSDMRRTAPERLKTLIRQPFQPQQD